MKVISVATFLALGLSVEAFQTQSSSFGALRTSTSLNGYVPSGFTPESYKKFKEDEAKKKAKAKN